MTTGEAPSPAGTPSAALNAPAKSSTTSAEFIARNGRCYRILDKAFVADHAGVSMWNGHRDISRLSVGIELVGYHYDAITA